MKYTITEKATGNVLLSVDCPSTPEERGCSFLESDGFTTDPSAHGLPDLYDAWMASAFHVLTPNNHPIEQDGFVFEFKDES